MKKAFITIGIIGLAGLFYGLYMYFKPPANTRASDADYTLSAAELASQFENDETKANQTYNDKIISISGEIVEITSDAANPTVLLGTGNSLTSISCSFYPEELEKISALKVGETVTIKGKCTGKLIDIVLNYCTLEDQNKSL